MAQELIEIRVDGVAIPGIAWEMKKTKTNALYYIHTYIKALLC